MMVGGGPFELDKGRTVDIDDSDDKCSNNEKVDRLDADANKDTVANTSR